MLNTQNAYYEALERLKKGQAIHVSKGSKITNDAVSIEAGRGKGSIKKSRAIFADLIRTIDEAAAEQSKPKHAHREQIVKVKSEADRYRSLWEESLSREISLLQELLETKQDLARLSGNKVLPFRNQNKKSGVS